MAISEPFLQQLGQCRLQLLAAAYPQISSRLACAFGLNAQGVNPSGLLAVGSRQANEIAAATYLAEMGQDWVESWQWVRSIFAEADRLVPDKAGRTPLVPGGRELLQSLTQAGVKVGIVSSDTTVNVAAFIEAHNLNSMVQVAIGCDQGFTKPDPALLTYAAQQLGVPLSATLMIGDSAADTLMARSAGVAGAIGVTWGWRNPVHVPSADVVLEDPAAIQVLDNAVSPGL